MPRGGRLAVIRKFLGKRANACPLNVYFDIFLGNCDWERGLATARGGGYRLLQMTDLRKAWRRRERPNAANGQFL